MDRAEDPPGEEADHWADVGRLRLGVFWRRDEGAADAVSDRWMGPGLFVVAVWPGGSMTACEGAGLGPGTAAVHLADGSLARALADAAFARPRAPGAPYAISLALTLGIPAAMFAPGRSISHALAAPAYALQSAAPDDGDPFEIVGDDSRAAVSAGTAAGLSLGLGTAIAGGAVLVAARWSGGGCHRGGRAPAVAGRSGRRVPRAGGPPRRARLAGRRGRRPRRRPGPRRLRARHIPVTAPVFS